MKTITENEAEERYNDFLDQAYGEVNVAGNIYNTSNVLKELDPIAYDVGMSDFLSSEELEIE